MKIYNILEDGSEVEMVRFTYRDGKVSAMYNSIDFDGDTLKKIFEESLYFHGKIQTPDDGVLFMGAVKEDTETDELSAIEYEPSDDIWMKELDDLLNEKSIQPKSRRRKKKTQ